MYKDISDEETRKKSKQLLDGRKQMREYRQFKEEALDRTLWRTGLRGCGPVVMQTGEWMDVRIYYISRYTA